MHPHDIVKAFLFGEVARINVLGLFLESNLSVI